MRVHITLDASLVRELDKRVGARQRSSFIARAVGQALDDQRRWELVQSSFGKISDTCHEWDRDPAAWVRKQRRMDARRVG